MWCCPIDFERCCERNATVVIHYSHGFEVLNYDDPISPRSEDSLSFFLELEGALCPYWIVHGLVLKFTHVRILTGDATLDAGQNNSTFFSNF
jgi:hypothetical protein